MQNEPLDRHETRLLSYLYAMYRGRTKTMIHHAWETGDYSDLGIYAADVAVLQQLRNTRGPSWLQGLQWKSVAADCD